MAAPGQFIMADLGLIAEVLIDACNRLGLPQTDTGILQTISMMQVGALMSMLESGMSREDIEQHIASIAQDARSNVLAPDEPTRRGH